MTKQRILSRPITSNGIESVIGKLTTNKIPGPDGFTNEFFHTFKANLIASFSKYSKILKRNINFQTLFEANITYIKEKKRKTDTKKIRKSQANDEYKCKIPQQNISKQHSTIH